MVGKSLTEVIRKWGDELCRLTPVTNVRTVISNAMRPARYTLNGFQLDKNFSRKFTSSSHLNTICFGRDFRDTENP